MLLCWAAISFWQCKPWHKALVWALVLLGLIVYVFAVLFTYLASNRHSWVAFLDWLRDQKGLISFTDGSAPFCIDRVVVLSP